MLLFARGGLTGIKARTRVKDTRIMPKASMILPPPA